MMSHINDNLMSVGVFLHPFAYLMTLFSMCLCRSRSHWNTSKSNAQTISSFKVASNFVCEVQHVSGVEWVHLLLTYLSVTKKCGTMTSCVCWWRTLSLSCSFQTYRRSICKVCSKWSRNMDVGDWTYIDLWKFIRKSPLQLLGKDIYLLINCLKKVVLSKWCWHVIFSHRWVQDGHIAWFASILGEYVNVV